ncbi:KIN14B-interacting protein At4g14310 [Coffea arabica]|uniref:KIN14B-interacting protein At4g14310 n=1 Tax=Coffea arabica TaxID=13443 RepID=A0A6P6WY55_COFAR|nr:KIN14B-interacting protein At4g14310-like [Coffea arabica]
MSTMSSVRRLKERGGGGAKITATAATTTLKHPKSLTPQSEKPLFSRGCGSKESLKRPAGKENSRPTSRGRAAMVQSQKPIMKAMPRMDKISAANGVGNGFHGFANNGVEGRPRWSTSSVPVQVSVQRGRSSSPSEFNRGLLSSGKSRNSSVEKKRGSFKCLNEKVGENSELLEGGAENLIKSGEVYDEKEVNLSSNSVKFKLDDSDEKLNLIRNVKIENIKDEKVESCLGNGVEFSQKESKSSSLMKHEERDGGELSLMIPKERDGGELRGSIMGNKAAGLSGTLKEKDVSEINSKESKTKESKIMNRSGGVLKIKDGNGNGVSGSSANVKYPSKLHEKLAFLEGKVRRIASDIKRTKEMLDLNNPDNSRMILSDIQEKITGIEKAMGSVGNNDDDLKANVVASSEIDVEKVKASEKMQVNKVDEGKSLVKALNANELEARLFPHHKLLRDRTSQKSASESAESHKIEVVVTDGELKVEKSISPVDENPIAMEFLASLSQGRCEDTIRVGTFGPEISEVQETDGAVTSRENNRLSDSLNGKGSFDLTLLADEKLEEFDDQENMSRMIIEEETEDSSLYELNQIGQKMTTGGWFVSEGESVLLAHDDGSCSFYDIINSEGKATYKPPHGVSPNMWRDCWLIRAPSADGCSGRYVVAASAGNSVVSGFCSWDFYTKEVRAFHAETGLSTARTALAPLPNNTIFRRNVLSTSIAPENQQWWYRPCGPLIVSAASSQRMVRVYDVRDGEHIMKWELQKPVLGMDYSSPLQWRNRGKVVIAESEAISLWDVSSLHPQALSSISSSNRKIDALHVNNTDAELGGGVRQRVSSSEAEGNDGVFCTSDFINVLDFRQPSGIGLKIPKVGVDVQSTFSRGDSVFMGCTNLRSAGRKQHCSQIQQFSLRKQRLYSTYVVPESNAHSHFTAITQVWGNSELVIGVNGQGLFVFDALKDDVLQSLDTDSGKDMWNVREVIGPDDLYSPSFDYLASRVLLVSRDRPALWRYLS